MKNTILIFTMLVGITLMGSCSKENADDKKANETKELLKGKWKITDARTDLYQNGILHKKEIANQYLNREFQFGEDGKFTEIRANESLTYKGLWSVFIVDTDDKESDAVTEGESYTTNLFLFYQNGDNKVVEKTTWVLTFKNSNNTVKSEMETSSGIVHLILEKQ